MNKQKGFTLIELLVVIAIIGILSSVVLVSVGSARKKANDAVIQAELGQVRLEAEMYLTDNPSGYNATIGLTGWTYGNMPIYKTSIKNNNGNNDPVLQASAGAYCAYSVSTASTVWYCVDSTGISKRTTTNPNTTCTAALFTCP